MAGGKETPRQKMIGMMYLVLTALLALNVSKEILHAFVVINDGLENTNKIFAAKNDATMNQFEQQMAFDPMKTKPFFERAQLVVAATEEIDMKIDELKKHIIRETAGYDETTADSMYLLRNIAGKDNYDKPTEILIGSEPSFPIETEHSALKLKEAIEGYRDELISVFNPEKDADLINEITQSLALRDVPKPEGGSESWITGNFYHMPLAAVVTNLTKLQTDIKNAEADALKALFKNIRLNDFKFDTIQAKVIPRSNYVLRGQEYEADVFLAAYSRTEQPTMLLGSYDSINDNFSTSDSLMVENGLGRIKLPTSSIGPKTYDGVIQLQKEDGTLENFHFSSDYIVAEPSLTVAPTKMNVLYKGITNPVEVSVPGVANENVRVSITGGNSITQVGNGAYEVKMASSSPRTVNVQVTAKLPNGEEQSMGSKEFRVKNLPKPYAKIGDIETTGRMNGNVLVSKQGIRAIYDNDFPFALTCTVDRFEVSLKYRGTYTTLKSNDNRWTQEMINAFKELPAGSQITFQEIKATGSDDVTHELSPIVITIQ